MQPQDTVALERARWASFVQELAEFLAAQWPAMPGRLGERYAAFVEHAVQQALERGFARAAVVARYANLCFVWGLLFQEKPGFEWAQGLLAAPRQRPDEEWAVSHRLVQRSLKELARRPGAPIDAAALATVDERLVDRFGALGRHGDLQPDEPPPVPRAACDLEALELRLLEPGQTHVYHLQGRAWQRVELAAPPPLRVNAARPLPRVVGLLARPPGASTPARLQLRARAHAVCDADRHPALDFAGTHGLWHWRGHETRAASWPVAALEQPLAAAGPGVAVAEETSPDIYRLTVQTCGLRDEDDPLGPLQAQVWAWPAEQWCVELERTPPPVQRIVAGGAHESTRAGTRCRVECDGVVVEPGPLRNGFEQGLDRAVDDALSALAQAWSGLPGLSQPAVEGAIGLLVGRAALTWGWHPGPGGLEGRAFMRLLAQIEMKACVAELQLQGELSLGGAAARVFLDCRQEAPLRLEVRREADVPPLLTTLLPARSEFRLPFTAELVPLGSDSGALINAIGSCQGALLGQAGLRPRTRGGSGFEWFASLRLEPVALPVQWVDPVLGVQTLQLTLLAERVLFDWSLG